MWSWMWCMRVPMWCTVQVVECAYGQGCATATSVRGTGHVNARSRAHMDMRGQGVIRHVSNSPACEAVSGLLAFPSSDVYRGGSGASVKGPDLRCLAEFTVGSCS